MVSALYYMDCARRQAEEDNLGPKLIGATLMGKRCDSVQYQALRRGSCGIQERI